MTENLAPILLFAFNRPKHISATLNSLYANELAPRSKLIIYADGPRRGATKSEVSAIAETRNIIRSRQWCGEVQIIEAEVNQGLATSILNGVSKTLMQYDRVIVLEDDLVLSPFFLSFMNDALTMYEPFTEVASIHGYVPPLPGIVPETFFLRGADCWGWATWRRAWSTFNTDAQELYDAIQERRLTKEFNLDGSYNFMKLLRLQAAGRVDSWAIRFHASAFLQGQLTLYPGRSLVRNIGLDSSGQHCGSTIAFDSPLSQSAIRCEFLSPAEDRKMRTLFSKFYWEKAGYFYKITSYIVDRVMSLFTRKTLSLMQ